MNPSSTNWGMIGLLVMIGKVFVVLVWNGRGERKDRR